MRKGVNGFADKPIGFDGPKVRYHAIHCLLFLFILCKYSL